MSAIVTLNNELDNLEEQMGELSEKIEAVDEFDDASTPVLDQLTDEMWDLKKRYSAISGQLYEIEKKDRNAHKKGDQPMSGSTRRLLRFLGFADPKSKRYRRQENRRRRRIKRFERDHRTVHIRQTQLPATLDTCLYHSLYLHKGSTTIITGGSRIPNIYVEKGAKLVVRADVRYRKFNPWIGTVWYEIGADVQASYSTIEDIHCADQMQMPAIVKKQYMREHFDRKPLRGKALCRHKKIAKALESELNKFKLNLSEA